MYEDTFRTRQLNELKMQQEFNTIKVLRKCMNESQEQTKRMTGLLDNFETQLTRHLHALRGLVMPDDATDPLQIKYANLQKTVTELNHVIEIYNSVENLSLVIQAGPGKDIKNYISHLNKLKLTIDFLSVDKNQSLRKQDQDLWSLGKQYMNREFDQTLTKFNDSTMDQIDAYVAILSRRESDFR